MARKTDKKTDEEATKRLRELWDKRRSERKITQEEAAEELQMSIGAVNQYLKGKLTLGVEATLRWAKLLGVSPEEIRPDIKDLVTIPREINEAVLEEVIRTVENILKEQGLESLKADLKARIVLIGYKEAIKGGSVNKDALSAMIQFAA